MEYQNIADKIIELKNADLELRDKLIKHGKLNDGYNAEMESMHNSNAKILDKIIEDIGYPSTDKLGKEASDSAWLIIQHAIGQPNFMRKCATLLKHAVGESKADTLHLAYLTDRIAVFEDRPQLYGTQFDWDHNGEMNPLPFDDIVKVNERRKSVGLKTLEEQIEIMRERLIIEKQMPPNDFKRRRQEYDEWRKKVGWIK